MAVANELVVVVRAEIDNALKNLNLVEKQTGKTEGGFKKFTSFLKTTGIGSFLAVGAAVAGVTKFLSSSEEAARDAQETISKFAFVFESMGSGAEEAATNFADSFGLADSTAKALLGTTGDLLVGMGATEGQALELSTQVNSLAADLASFSNIEGGTERASHALTAALLGEREQAKMLGVVIRETDVQQKLMERGQEDLTGQALLLAKAQVTLELATEQSQKAIGDYARTQDSAANVMRRAEEATKALKEAVGTSVVEAVTPFRRAWINVAESLAEAINKSHELKGVLSALQGEGGLTTDDIGRVSSAIETLDEKIANMQNRRDEGGATDQLIADRAELEKQLRMLQQLEYQEIRREDAAMAALRRAEEAEAERAAAAAAQAADLAALNDAFSHTREGEIAATEASIAYFESFIQTPKVIAVLEELRGKLEDLKDTEEEATGYVETLESGYRMYENTAVSSLDGVKAAEEALAEIRAEKAAEFEEQVSNANDLFTSLGSTMETYGGLLTDVIQGEKTWAEAAKEAAKDAGAAVLRALAEEAFAKAAFYAASAIIFPTPGNIGAAIGYGAAGVAAMAGAGAITALAEGGIVTKPTTALIGEAGPEAVVPLSGGGFGNTTIHIHGTMVMQDQVEAFIARVNSKNNRGY